MKHLKIAGAQWAGYTGNIGVIAFKDGVSTEPVPRAIADRISAAIAMVEVDEDDNELEAGVAARLVRDAGDRASITEPLERQTDADRAAEELRLKLAANKAPSDRLYSEDELDALIKKGGIKALREAAAPWNVKGRAIPELMTALLAAQSKFIADRDAKLEPAAAEEIVSETQTTDEAELGFIKPPIDPSTAIALAAATGDLAAALNTGSEGAGDTTSTDETETTPPQIGENDGATGE